MKSLRILQKAFQEKIMSREISPKAIADISTDIASKFFLTRFERAFIIIKKEPVIINILNITSSTMPAWILSKVDKKKRLEDK